MNWHWLLYCLAHPRTVDPEIVFVIVKYWILFYVFISVAYMAATEGNWLEKFCNNNRDAAHYQIGSPP